MWLFRRRVQTPSVRERMIESVAHMNGVIHCFSPFYFDIRGPIDSHILIDEWVESQKPERLDVLLELVIDPPPQADELWNDSVSQLLAGWAKHDAGYVLPKLGPLLLDATNRLLILETFSAIACNRNFRIADPKLRDSALDWLEPLIPQADQLPEDDQSELVDAIGRINSERSKNLLKRLQSVIPADAGDAHQVIARYLSSETECNDAGV